MTIYARVCDVSNHPRLDTAPTCLLRHDLDLALRDLSAFARAHVLDRKAEFDRCAEANPQPNEALRTIVDPAYQP
jgi:hypothetical protein